jgi:hypothetical protein
MTNNSPPPRLQRLEHLFARFSQKCDSLASWITETKAFFKKDNIAEADLNELLVRGILIC